MIVFREHMSKKNYYSFDYTFTLYSLIACTIFAIVRKIFFVSSHNYIYEKILPKYQNEERLLHT